MGPHSNRGVWVPGRRLFHRAHSIRQIVSANANPARIIFFMICITIQECHATPNVGCPKYSRRIPLFQASPDGLDPANRIPNLPSHLHHFKP